MDRGTVEIMTKRLAADVSRRHVGYFSPGEPGRHDADYVICPLCREHVGLTDRPYPRSLYAPSAGEIRQALVRHLTDPYDDSRCACVKAVRSGSEWKW